jgi:hypothetical protein
MEPMARADRTVAAAPHLAPRRHSAWAVADHERDAGEDHGS